jgi:signal transduction histidine kinase
MNNAPRSGRPPIRVTASLDSGDVVVRVWDAGDGVPEEFEGRLFTAFSRVDPGAGEGTGLGLSIIKGLAEVNGGDVLYERSEAEGVCFGVRLQSA